MISVKRVMVAFLALIVAYVALMVASAAPTVASLVFPLPPRREGPPTATKTPPPARGWAAGNSHCRFFVWDFYGIP